MKKMILLLLLFIFVNCSKDSVGPTQPQNHAPVIVSMVASPASIINSGSNYSTISVVATDKDGDDLTYTFTAEFGFLSDQNIASIRWMRSGITGPGDYTIKCTVNDGKAVAIDSVIVTVTEPPEPTMSTINIEPMPADGIYLNSDDSRLYVAYWSDDSPYIQEYDLSNYSLIQTIPFGSWHNHGDVVLSSNDRYLFTPNYYFSNISRIDLQGGNARSDLNVGSSWPWEIGITPDKSKILVAVGMDGRSYDMNNDQITIIDIANYSVIAEVVLNDEPQRGKIGFSSDSRIAYVATRQRKSSSNMLYEISLQPPYNILRSVSIGSAICYTGVAVTSSKAFVNDYQNGQIMVFDLSSFTQTSTISVGGNPLVLAITPDGNYLYVLDRNEIVLIINVSNNTIIETITGLYGHSTDIEFTKDGSKAYISYSGAVGKITVLH